MSTRSGWLSPSATQVSWEIQNRQIQEPGKPRATRPAPGNLTELGAPGAEEPLIRRRALLHAHKGTPGSAALGGTPASAFAYARFWD
jgi:hypothetical protein